MYSSYGITSSCTPRSRTISAPAVVRVPSSNQTLRCVVAPAISSTSTASPSRSRRTNSAVESGGGRGAGSSGRSGAASSTSPASAALKRAASSGSSAISVLATTGGIETVSGMFVRSARIDERVELLAGAGELGVGGERADLVERGQRASENGPRLNPSSRSRSTNVRCVTTS